MSKSLGNFVTIDQALENHSAEGLRLYLLQAHYASPIDFAWDSDRKVSPSIEEAERGLGRLYAALRAADRWLQGAPAQAEGEPTAEGRTLDAQREESRAQFYESMDDDFSTPRAVAALFTMAGAINRFAGLTGPASGADRTPVAAARAELEGLSRVLGILEQPPEAGESGAQIGAVVEQVIAWRQAARQRRDFALADQIRNDLKDAGILLEDHPGGTTTWRVA